MTQAIDSLIQIADRFDAIVLDQWGVLHDGSAPYPTAIAALNALAVAGKRLAVLSNSGKRSGPNLHRIARMGFDPDLFETVMTSGEALWQDLARGRLAHTTFYPITSAAGDAEDWADGLDITLTDTLARADAVLLMGLPYATPVDSFREVLKDARLRGIPVLCTNPDRASLRADGVVVVSPGALAHAHLEAGGDLRFYGKPHRPVFDAVQSTLNLPAARVVIVGDSLEHDIAGGHGAGWATVFIQRGLHAIAFAQGHDPVHAIIRLAKAEGAPLPDFTLSRLE